MPLDLELAQWLNLAFDGIFGCSLVIKRLIDWLILLLILLLTLLLVWLLIGLFFVFFLKKLNHGRVLGEFR